MGKCNYTPSRQGLFGVEQLTELLIFPSFLIVAGFGLFHLIRRENTPWEIKVPAVCYLILACLHSIYGSFASLVGFPLHFPKKYKAFCPFTAAILLLLGTSAYLCLIWYYHGRLKVTFQHASDSIRVSKRMNYIVYTAIISAWITYAPLVVGASTGTKCYEIDTADFILIGKKGNVQGCGGFDRIYQFIIFLLGMLIVGSLATLLCYEYVSRLRHVFVASMSYSNIKQSSLNIIRKSTILGVFSVVMSVLAFLVSAIPGVGFWATNVDLFLNAVCLVCTFRFGQPVFDFLMYPCRNTTLVQNTRVPEESVDTSSRTSRTSRTTRDTQTSVIDG